ncbi:helix-turn-helix domain-containing protein [Nonomuraea monospora]|uniref:Helix-turn-helix domain-containing protein n=1 Tax=Nonomuraea monospora TaxID=568818 RepID=A0ABN3CB78_9ACTN
MVANDLSRALARRLRRLREGQWPGLRITQQQLSRALGVSVPLISSWESAGGTPRVPPLHRLEAYAAFFATRRSLADGVPRVLPPAELSPEEREEQRRLLGELSRLRSDALRALTAEPGKPAQRAGPPADPWHFPDGGRITIICSELPPSAHREVMRNVPDYVALYRFADLDSLFELYGHLRALNPRSPVSLRAVKELNADDLTNHVVLLGGPDYNDMTASMLRRVRLPVRQVSDWNGEKGPYFEVEARQRYHPVLQQAKDLLEDVGHFYRGPNPNNIERTLSICNGMYARGVYGVVRALTDHRFSERNAAHLRARFGTAAAYSILTRVRMEGRIVLTPDWTRDSYRLHEWSMPSAAD